MPGIKTLRAMSSALKNREISSTELTQEHLAKIAADKTNSFVTVAKDNALEQAKQAQQRREQESSHPLTGVPLAHKDIFCTQGITTTCGSRMLENFVAPYDAHVVALLNQAGMVTLGKTNMDEFAMGSSNESSHFGPVSNPWNLDKVPGGSSGGSAAAVAAGLVAC